MGHRNPLECPVGEPRVARRRNFLRPFPGNAKQFPIAAPNHFGHVNNEPDLVTSKLSFHQLATLAPAPPKGSFDEEAAKHGDELFSGKAQCASCHTSQYFASQVGTFTKAAKFASMTFKPIVLRIIAIGQHH